VYYLRYADINLQEILRKRCEQRERGREKVFFVVFFKHNGMGGGERGVEVVVLGTRGHTEHSLAQKFMIQFAHPSQENKSKERERDATLMLLYLSSSSALQMVFFCLKAKERE